MEAARSRRLQKELKEFTAEGFTGGPLADLNSWRVALPGPAPPSPYSEGQFWITIQFPQEYPFKAPLMKFETKVFHPNVSMAGAICLDILKSEWSPVLSISRVLVSLQSLLDDPNVSSPLNGDAARLYKESRAKYDQEVRKWVRMYASK